MFNDYMADFLEYMEVERGRSVKTIENYAHYLNRFDEFAGEIKVEKITLDTISKWRQWLNRYVTDDGRSISRTTQNYHLIAMRSFLRYLVKRDVKSLSPDKIELAQAKRPQVSFLDKDEVHRLMEAVKTDTMTGLRDKAILAMLFSTGLRVSELVALNHDSVNLDRGEFSVRGKGQKDRPVYLSESATLILSDYLEARHDEYDPLFIHFSGTKSNLEGGEYTRLTTRSIQRIVEKYTKLAGITKHVTPHTLRHSFATDLLMNGADIRSVQGLLGHSNISTTQVYTHITDPHLKDVHKKFHSDNS